MKKFDNFCTALDNLKNARSYDEPYDTVTQTNIAALFEMCFEQAWKTMKAVLEERGKVPDGVCSPKITVKLAYGEKLINDEITWLAILDTINLLSHLYSEEDLSKEINDIKTSFTDAFDKLKTELETNWI